MREPSVKRWAARDCQRPRWQSGKSVAPFALVAMIAGLLCGAREVLGAEYVDRGDVSMDCTDGCACTGSSDDGTFITVFDNPSSGGRVRVRIGESKTVGLYVAHFAWCTVGCSHLCRGYV